MYYLINQHIDQLLLTIDATRDIQPYVSLIHNFNEVNVAANMEFQRTYRRYWQLNAARLGEDFCKVYFALLEELKQERNTGVDTVARRLWETPTHGDGRQSLQFSFASKLAHMLNNHLPIYDSLVESFYFLPTGSATEKFEEKLQRLLASYKFLIAEYNRVLANGLLAYAIERFRAKFALG